MFNRNCKKSPHKSPSLCTYLPMENLLLVKKKETTCYIFANYKLSFPTTAEFSLFDTRTQIASTGPYRNEDLVQQRRLVDPCDLLLANPYLYFARRLRPYTRTYEFAEHSIIMKKREFSQRIRTVLRKRNESQAYVHKPCR
jgi:hypothetical protein